MFYDTIRVTVFFILNKRVNKNLTQINNLGLASVSS